jgi:hypothetical protein
MTVKDRNMTFKEGVYFVVGGAIVGLIGWLVTRRRDPEDRPPVVVTNGSILIQAIDSEPSDQGNCHKGKTWTDRGKLVKRSHDGLKWVHEHSGRAVANLIIKVQGSTNQADGFYYVKSGQGHRATVRTVHHRQFTIGVTGNELELVFDSPPHYDPATPHRLQIQDPQSQPPQPPQQQPDKLEEVTIPVQGSSPDVVARFAGSGSIEVRSRWQ